MTDSTESPRNLVIQRAQSLSKDLRIPSAPIDAASESYAQRPSLRALVQTIPFLGNYIDNLVTTRASAIAERRICDLLEAFCGELQKIDESALRKDFLQSEGFDHLLLESLRRAARSRSSGKIRRFAFLLARVASHPSSDDDTEAALELLDALTDREFEACVTLVRLQSERSQQLGEEEYQKLNDLRRAIKHTEVAESLREDPGIVRGMLARSASKGAAREIAGSYLSYEGGAYQPLPTLLQLIDLVQSASANAE